MAYPNYRSEKKWFLCIWAESHLFRVECTSKLQLATLITLVLLVLCRLFSFTQQAVRWITLRNLAAGFSIPKLLDFTSTFPIERRSPRLIIVSCAGSLKTYISFCASRVRRGHACANLFSVKAGCTQTAEAYRSHFGRRTYRRSYVYA